MRPTVVVAAEHVSVAVVVFVTIAGDFRFAWLLFGAAVPVLNQLSSFQIEKLQQSQGSLKLVIRAETCL